MESGDKPISVIAKMYEILIKTEIYTHKHI